MQISIDHTNIENGALRIPGSDEQRQQQPSRTSGRVRHRLATEVNALASAAYTRCPAVISAREDEDEFTVQS